MNHQLNEEIHIMDWKRLHMFTNGDAVETKEFIDMFTECADESLRIMCKFCAEDANELWKQAAHKLCGSAANFGAAVLAKKCREAELSWTQSYAIKQDMVDEIMAHYSLLQKLLANTVLDAKT